jgi:hypothetical protein
MAVIDEATPIIMLRMILKGNGFYNASCVKIT